MSATGLTDAEALELHALAVCLKDAPGCICGKKAEIELNKRLHCMACTKKWLNDGATYNGVPLEEAIDKTFPPHPLLSPRTAPSVHIVGLPSRALAARLNALLDKSTRA